MAKKIALITTKPGVVSGVTVFMDLLEKELRARGFEVELIRPVPHSFQHMTAIASILGYGMTREQLKGFDLVMGNGIGLTGAIDLPIKIIDNIHSTASGANQSLSRAIEQLTDLEKEWLDRILPPLVGETHHDLMNSLSMKANAFEVDNIAAKRADAMVTVSYSTRDEVIEFFDIGEKPVTVVPNGVGERWFEERSYMPIVAEHPVNVVHTGRAGYTPINILWKGFDRILAVLGSVQGAHPVGIFHLGASDKRDAYAKLLSDQNISFAFDVENAALPQYLRAGDIYVQTSRYEACSLSLMEAMASGLAPIAFPSGMSEVQIKNGKNGFIVHTIEEMRERVQQLIGDPGLRQEMGREAARTMREEYSVSTMVDGYVKIINELL